MATKNMIAGSTETRNHPSVGTLFAVKKIVPLNSGKPALLVKECGECVPDSRSPKDLGQAQR